ncbi:MAG: V/A-type H+/Na+-transporting ATPase subunit [Pyrococcus sp.]|uniref:V-type ATP synthase subunit E n=1 Tax=Pyrococcus sp. TaxID=33866 RepID=UPI0025888884|nr:V-type ATP synthase subunit E [Pyrococcus sp.]MDK2869935.1 V/A-type H+/Na+-transporting ATPase subunit [Pyrococcus sp.]
MNEAQIITQEINREAEQKIKYILEEARKEAEKIKEEARKRGESRAEWILRKAKTQAELEKQRIIATARLEVRRKKLSVQEEYISRVLKEVTSKLSNLSEEEYLETVLALLKEAIKELEVKEIRVYSNEKTLALISSRIEEIRRELGDVSIEIGSPIQTIGGVVVETKDGNMRVDNTFEARMARFESELRSKIAEILFG